MFSIIYPEKKIITNDTIKLWYLDALANGDTEEIIKNDDYLSMAYELQCIGHITLNRMTTPIG